MISHLQGHFTVILGIFMRVAAIELFVDIFVYLNLINYWTFVNQGIDLGVSEEEWILHLLGPNGEIPQLYRAFSNTGYTSSEEDEDNNQQ